MSTPVRLARGTPGCGEDIPKQNPVDPPQAMANRPPRRANRGARKQGAGQASAHQLSSATCRHILRDKTRWPLPATLPFGIRPRIGFAHAIDLNSRDQHHNSRRLAFRQEKSSYIFLKTNISTRNGDEAIEIGTENLIFGSTGSQCGTQSDPGWLNESTHQVFVRP
jgi:hypothetical protein